MVSQHCQHLLQKPRIRLHLSLKADHVSQVFQGIPSCHLLQFTLHAKHAARLGSRQSSDVQSELA